MREVREETGVTVGRASGSATSPTSTVATGGGSTRSCTTSCARSSSGSTADHDHEVDDARWIPLEEARTALTYPGERRLIARAIARLTPDRD